jgi:hypothetical protein
MNSCFYILNINDTYTTSLIKDKNKLTLLKNDFLPVLENKMNQGFEIIDSHIFEKDFQLLIRNPTLIFGLNGPTIIWIPVNDENKDDYYTLKNSKNNDEIKTVFRKYNILFWNQDRMNEIKKEILNNPLFVNKIPYYLNKLEKEKCLYLTKNLIVTNNQNCKIISFSLKKSENVFQKINEISFENYSNKPVKNTLGVIIFCKGHYNDKNFEKSFLSLEEPDLKTIFYNIKNILNTRYRESLLDSLILEKYQNKSLDLGKIKIEKNNQLLIQNYFINFSKIYSENRIPDLIYKEKIENTWEEYDSDEIYKEITIFNCNIWISIFFI